MHITGACHCRAIRYEADVLATSVSICHCSDCQILTGAAFRISIPAAEGSFRLLSGVPRIYTKTADSGRLREQAFCERCGSPIYATSPGPEPRTYNIRVGTIDQRNELKPCRQIWSRSQLPWLAEISATPRLERDG
ncbi:MAG TPA: GFA family protein [Polyangiaceae bacterium]|nr:GFA family protein [Polyangiaceae bacterium]